MSTSDESVDELLETTFDGIRNPATEAINKIVDFIGKHKYRHFYLAC